MSKLTAKDVRAALRDYFGSDANVVMEEVSDAAGFDRSRSADMITMGLWPSRGLLLQGIEIKVSRADWLSELKDPSKADTFFRYCDRWWIATGDADIVREGELPDPWGHLTVAGGKVKIVKPAPKLDPVPLERGFLAAMLKRASTKSDSALTELVEDRVRERMVLKRREDQWRYQRIEADLSDARQRILAFEKATGLNISYPSQEHMALFQAMKRAHEFTLPGASDVADRLDSMENTLVQTLHGIRSIRDAYGPTLKQFEAQKPVELPAPVPSSLLALNAYGSGVSHCVGTGHVFNVSHGDVTREKVKTSRGFIRIWEPPLLGAGRTRGTKRRPSVRMGDREIVPNYRLSLRHVTSADGALEAVYTEVTAAVPSWDLLVLAPQDWTLREHSTRLDCIVDVDERPHAVWAVTVDMDTPIENLGAWIMGVHAAAG